MKKIYAITAAAVLITAALTSCVQDKVYSVPTISGIEASVAYTADDEVTVSATVASLVGISSATLHYTNSGSWTSAPMTAAGTDRYTGTIPGQPVNTEVSYYIEAEGSEGDTVTSATLSYVVGQAPVDYTGLVLNELNGNDKFIEIYNGSSAPIPMTGLVLYKDSEKSVWTGPAMTLDPGEYLLLYSEDVTADHPDHPADLIFGSGLSAKKNVRIQLQDPKGADIDDFNVVNHPGGTVAGSYGRNADGGWYIQPTATPGTTNADGSESITSWLQQ